MSVIIQLNESNASRRVVPLPPLVQSNGTSACTNESGRTFGFMIGGIDYGSGGSISVVSSVMGTYACLFAASKVSALGQGMVYYGGTSSSSTALPACTPIEVVATNSYDSMRYGLFALPNLDPTATGGLIVSGTGTNQLHVSSGSVGLKAQTHSQATIGGINNILEGNYSGRSFEILTGGIQTTSIGKGAYSGVSVEIKTKGIATSSIETANVYSYVSWGAAMEVGSSVSIHAGTHSDVTIKGIQNYANISSVTLNIGTHSGATIDGVNRVNSSVTIVNNTYSGVTVRIEGVNYSGATIDGVRMLAPPAERSIASSLMSTNLGGTRTIQQSFHAIRNKVLLSGSTGTVFLEDDTTSSWTFTVSTGTATVYGIDPGIA